MRLTLPVFPEAALEKSLTKALYIHIPFCLKKCSYCDFYSGSFNDEIRAEYIVKLTEEIKKWGRLNTCPIDTVYFGGGTPSLLTPREFETLMTAVRSSFIISDNAEITTEVNPGDNFDFLRAAYSLGVNRISLGMQSADDDELKMLGRRHTYSDVVQTVSFIKKLGISNISADIMIGLPYSSVTSLKNSIDGVLSLEVPHISSYILKLEDGTPMAQIGVKLPDDDNVADQYLYMSSELTNAGFSHYEISNFAVSGFESRHNTKYWLCEEYLGIGPGAHSFYNSKRFFYPRSIKDFINDAKPIYDGIGGDKTEYIMLALRLSRGLKFSEFEERFGKLSQKFIDRAKMLRELCVIDDKHIHLTDKGMLLSNSVITNLLEAL